MGPGETFATLAVIAGMVGTTITLALSWMRHRERMAGTPGAGSGRLAETVAMLTETLERQHERQTALAARLDALEAAPTAPLAAHLGGETTDVSSDDRATIGRGPVRA